MTALLSRSELDALVKQSAAKPTAGLSNSDLLLILEMLNERVKDLERIVYRRQRKSAEV